MRRRILIPAALALALLTMASPAGAHPLDTLGQLFTVQLGPEMTEVSLTIGGGMLANEMVLQDLDSNGDGCLQPTSSTTGTANSRGQCTLRWTAPRSRLIRLRSRQPSPAS